MLGCLSPLLAFLFRQKGFQVFSADTQGTSIFGHTVVVRVLGIHTVNNVVGQRCHDHVDFGPVVETLVLLFVELAYFFVLYAFEL